ncbi:carbonic anhydrase family protein, partial [Aquimarina megaterium]|uniref:carbonic anhydrase family protein n=1 Tax=Aquimarina megaterium TaxID=1443666 RepID=UPI0004710175
NYTTSTTTIVNNGHTLRFDYTSGSSASLNNIDYDLLQFHFHTGSEHTVNGNRYPMEMHLVHRNSTTGLLAVVGIFFTEGSENEVLSQFMDNLPKHKDEYYTSNEEYHI